MAEAFLNDRCSAEFEAQSAPVRINLVKDAEAPEVFMVYRNEGRINSNGKVDVEFRVYDGSGIKSVTINGRERMDGSSKDSVKFHADFYSDEEIFVKATDNNNNVNNRNFIVKASVAVAGAKATRKYVALLLAVDEYDDPAFQSLSGPISDATSLKAILMRKYGFEEANITFLKNPKHEDLETVFETMRDKVTGEDLLLIFYAGHGTFDDQSQIGYWLPSDATKSSRLNWYRNSALVENIGAIHSKHTLLIADACFSGGIFKTRSVNNASAEISSLMKRTSRKAMTSGRLNPVPDRSVFMKYLLKTLEENENKFLPSEDLYDMVKMAMKTNTDTKPEYGEIKNTGDEGGNFVFIQNN
jgi:hypothetical protein